MGVVKKPWGTYEVLLDESNYKVKRIIVFPEQRFSLQYHNHREEHWSIVGGYGTIILGNINAKAARGSRWIIPQGVIHRATAGNEKFIFIETQIGNCWEEDIVRLEDDYNRILPK